MGVCNTSVAGMYTGNLVSNPKKIFKWSWKIKAACSNLKDSGCRNNSNYKI